jgi:hypothetical protein
MRYLAPATDVHDELDLVTIPSLGKADAAPRKSAARETLSSRKARAVQSRAAGEVTRSSARYVNLGRTHFQDGVAESAVP